MDLDKIYKCFTNGHYSISKTETQKCYKCDKEYLKTYIEYCEVFGGKTTYLCLHCVDEIGNAFVPRKRKREVSFSTNITESFTMAKNGFKNLDTTKK